MSGSGDYNEQVIAVFPKNDTTEVRMSIKRVRTRATGKLQEFIDIREYWFKDGPMAEPLATRKGAMVNRMNIGSMIRVLTLSLKDGEMAEEDIATALSRLESVAAKESEADAEVETQVQSRGTSEPPPDFDDDDSV